MNIEQLKTDLIETLNSMDKNKMSLSDLRVYAEIVKIASDIQSKSYAECLAQTLSATGFGLSGPTVSDLK